MLKQARRFGVVAALIVTAALSASVNVTAETAPVDGVKVAEQVFSSANPKAAHAALSSAEKAAFRAATSVAKTETGVVATGLGQNLGKTLYSVDAAMGAQGCWYFQFWGSTKSTAGNTLYTFWQNTAVCVTSGRVTSVWVDNARGETSTPGWRFEGDKTKTWTKNVGWEGRGIAQYVFILGVGGWDVSQPTTCLQGRVNADGVNKASSYSCNIG